MVNLLSDSEINSYLNQLPDWELEGKTIKRTFVWQDFITAIDFVNQLVEPAEAAQHHPDIKIVYNQVTISLTTHDAGGLTVKDIEMAKTIDSLYNQR